MAAHVAAQARTRAFRQRTSLAVTLTALLLLLTGTGAGQPPASSPSAEPVEALQQATGTLALFADELMGFLPKLLLSLLIVAVIAVAARLITAVLRRVLGSWERAEAVAALTRIGLYLLALAIALSVIAGDVGALLGSLGLVGLALSWALQTPIESFTGWFLNSLRGYYRVGDRIGVGDVFGDVYRIDVLTTTVWEAGGTGKAVKGAQPTGAMITFPNWEVLRSNIVNYSREFPFVWDEVTVSITNESDLAYAARVAEAAARQVVGPGMAAAAERYRHLLSRAGIAFDVEEDPSVFFSPADAWINCTVRYLVDARSRRRRASDVFKALSAALADPAHAGRVQSAYPRTEIVVRRVGRGRPGASSPATPPP